MNEIKKILSLFIEEIAMEDFTQLKYTLNDNEIDQYLEEWARECAKQFLPKKIADFSDKKTLPLKKTFHLKVTVEREEMTVD